MDPIHLGHLVIAEEARARFRLEEVVFIPTGEPWIKSGMDITPANHRMNMVRLAIASNPFFRASSIELDRLGPSYTVDTLEELNAGDYKGDDLYFILGVDLIQEFHRWKRPDRILDLCTLVVAPRAGYEDGDASHLESVNPAAPGRVVFLEGPVVGISGTEIRERAARGCSIRYVVPEAVEAYVRRYGLYRNGGVEQ